MSHPVSPSVPGYPTNAASPLLPGSASMVAATIDVLAILLAGMLAPSAYWLATEITFNPAICVAISVLLAMFFVLLMQSWGLYETRHLLAIERQTKSAAAAWLVSLGLVLEVAFLLKASADLSRGAILLFAAFGLVALTGHRLGWRPAFNWALQRGLLRRRRALVVSLQPWSNVGVQIRLLRRAGVDVAGRHIVGGVPDERCHALARVIAGARQHGPDEVVILVSHDDLPSIERLIAELRPLPLPIRLLPDPSLSKLSLQPTARLGHCALIDVARAPLNAAEQAQKRAFDVVVALVGLLLVTPLLLATIAAIRIDTAGPVLFRQGRRGFNGRTFRILKLRTMTVTEDGGAIAQATRQDPRVTRVGAWLRRTSIDELPQLWNVLRGEMSIVGPRPHAVAHDDHFHRLIQNYAFRHHVKPGITGWAQVNGLRGETPEVGIMAARVEHDLWYVNNWSMRTDLRIVLLTVTRLFAPNAY